MASLDGFTFKFPIPSFWSLVWLNSFAFNFYFSSFLYILNFQFLLEKELCSKMTKSNNGKNPVKTHNILHLILHKFLHYSKIQHALSTVVWKWTIQGLNPIQIYHKILWKTNFQTYFYKICQGIMLPIHQVVFDKRARRLSDEAKIDIFPIGRWFGEEMVIYVYVFGIIEPPHVLLWYFPDKLLAREISYQTIGDGITKTLKESKKYLRHSFPL